MESWITIRTTLSPAEATVVERTLKAHAFDVRTNRQQFGPFGEVPIDIAVKEGRAVEAVLFLAQFLRRDRQGRLRETFRSIQPTGYAASA